MQTQTHALLAGALVVPLRRRGVDVIAFAVVIGAILPDIPFFLLTLAGEGYYRWIAPPPQSATIMEYLHFTLFYHDPLWIIGHNFFHSLVIDTLLLLMGLWLMRRGSRWGKVLFWLAASMLVHVAIDIVTHQSDGPLIWFPLSWTYRFASPVSYWDSAYFGRSFLAFEYTLDLVLAVFLVVTYRSVLRAQWQQWHVYFSHLLRSIKGN